MANIQNELNNIKNAIYGKDVRNSIHDAIKTCYDDASVNNDNANMEVKLARGTHNTLNDRLCEVDEKQNSLSSQLEHNATLFENLQIINVKDFGAIGNGVESSEIDQKAFDNAIKELVTITTNGDIQTGNCELYIPHGRYYIGELNIPCGTKIRGCGMWNTMLFHNKGEYLIKIIGDKNHPPTLITDLNIRGGYHSTSNYSLNFTSRTAINIQNCWLSANKSILIQGSFDNKITGCIFDCGNEGIYISNAGNTIITNNIFWGLKLYSISLTNSNNIIINSNQFSCGLKDGITSNSSDTLQIANNTFLGSEDSNSAGYNIKLDNTLHFNVSNNIMKKCRTNAITLDNNSSFGKINNNIINYNSRNSSNGIALLTCSNIDVMNNTIQNASIYNLLSRGNYVKIIGNYIDTVLDNTTKSITTGSCAITITGDNNTIDDNKVVSNKNFEFALYVAPNITVINKTNDFGSSSDYTNVHNAVQTTAGATLKNAKYVDPQHYTTTGTTDLIALRDYINTLVTTLIKSGVLKG